MGERRGNWMEFIQKFDLDIKPVKIVKGQGLCKLVVEAQDLINAKDPYWENELSLWCSKAIYIPPRRESWYGNLFYLLHQGSCLRNINPRERRYLRLKSAQYHLINFVFFCINYDVVLLRFLEHDDVEKVVR
jgi:hypothetical protein